MFASTLKRLAPTLALAILVATSTIYGCSDSNWSKIDTDEVRELMPKMALLSASFDLDNTPDSIRQATYRALLGEHGYTIRDWDSTLAWYAGYDIDVLNDIYRQVADSLSRLQAYLQARQDSIYRHEEWLNNRRGGTLDSINLLSIGTTPLHAGELINRPFAFFPSSPYDSSHELTLSTRLYGLPQLDTISALELELRLHFVDSTSLVARQQIRTSGRHAITMTIPEGKTVRRVSGHLRGVVPSQLRGGFIFTDSLRLVRLPRSMAAAVAPAGEVEPAPTLSDTIAADAPQEL